MGPRVGLGVVEKIKIYFLYRNSKPEPSSPVAILTALPGSQSLNTYRKKREMVQTRPENLGVNGILLNLLKYGVKVE